MTKQEQIEKMATTMCGYYNDGMCIFRNCAPCDKFNSQECSYKEDAEELYYAGYRKSNEVRNETAKEIYEKTKEKDSHILAWEYGEGYLDCMKNLKEVISEYGVEADE